MAHMYNIISMLWLLWYKIIHNGHAQEIDHIHFRHLMMDDKDAKAKIKKKMVLSSEIIEIAKSPDIFMQYLHSLMELILCQK